MNEFALVVIGLILLACLFVLFPLMRVRKTDQQSRRQINAQLFKARLDETLEERDRKEITEDEFQRLKIEQERQLLEDVDHSETNTLVTNSRPWSVLLVLSFSIAVFAWFFYTHTGAKADWDITLLLKQMRQIDSADEQSKTLAKQLIEKLSDRLEQKVDDPHYLMLLANTEMSLQNFPAAAGAYQRMVAIVPNDARILAQYAQALYLSSDRQMTAKVTEIMDKTLALQPDQPTVLGMLGIHNFEQGNYQVAIDYWQQLLPSLGPVSPNAKMIRQYIKEAEKLSGKKSPALEVQAASTADSVQVKISLADNITAPDNAPVFVFARAVSGPRMPLAVARLTVADLPTSITLDDSMAMTATLKLSNFDQVEVVARVSKKGIANRGPGDIEGIIGPVTLSTISEPLTLLIDQILP